MINSTFIHISRSVTVDPFGGFSWRGYAIQVITVLAVVVTLIVALPGLLRIGGLGMVATNGNSMGLSIPDGSLVITRSVEGSTLHAGDVIVFEPAWTGIDQSITNVVHRLSLIAITADGLVAYTSGDANLLADPLPVKLSGEQSLVVYVVPATGILYGSIWSILHGSAIALAGLLLVYRVRSTGRREGTVIRSGLNRTARQPSR